MSVAVLKGSDELVDKTRMKGRNTMRFGMLRVDAGTDSDGRHAKEPETLTPRAEQLKLNTDALKEETAELRSPLKNERIVCLSSQRDSKSSENNQSREVLDHDSAGRILGPTASERQVIVIRRASEETELRGRR